MHLPLETLKGRIDFAILTIREDECGAVLDRFAPQDYTEGQRRYEVGELTSISGRKLSFVVARCVKQGEGEAHRLTDYLIQDLDPSLFVLVGIGGSVPSKDFTLGDVVCATHVQDFCVRAVKEGGASTFNVGGGEMHNTILSLLGSLPQIIRTLPEWNTLAKIGCEPPAIEALTPRKTTLLYGSPQWRKEVCECVVHHFADGKRVKSPTATARPVASSDTLVKDTETIQTWLTDARAVAAVEMELAGVYTAARKPHKEYPILAVRGISDIVGLRRDDGWTAYACHTAASFAYAFFRAGVADGFLTRAAAARAPGRGAAITAQLQAASAAAPVQDSGAGAAVGSPPAPDGGPRVVASVPKSAAVVPTAKTFRFVHLSDIHFGQEVGAIHGPHHNVRSELIRDCKERFGSLGKADGILINGDIAFSGKKDQFDRAAAWIGEMAAAVGCAEETDVRVIPGNHDVDRSQINYFCDTVHNHLRGIDSAGLDAELAKIAAANEESNPLLPKLNNYRVFASRYGCDFNPVERLSWRKTYAFDANHRFEIVGLTSVLVCDGNDAKDKMILGSNQYIIERVEDVEFFVMIHHPLTWFKDYHDAQRYLDRARVVLMGHEHMQRINKETVLSWGDSLRVFAGATNAPENSGAYAYRYSWLEFALRIDGDQQFIRVTVYPRVWDHTLTKFVADRNALNGAESAFFDLQCPNYKKPPAVAPASPASSGSPTLGKEGVVGTQPNPRDIDRLHHFFWAYIDEWQDRMRILVGLDLLPETKNQPLPHTMERMALESATTVPKLHALWEAVMPHVPQLKRKPNPFPASEGGK
jgi:nucleoside phosphorylase/predicted phosphodiesterase